MHYNGANSYLFVNGTEIHQFKAKDSEIVANTLCQGNISKDFSVVNMKKTGSNGYVYDFSVDYDAITVDDILDIQEYLMEKNNSCHDLMQKAMNFNDVGIVSIKGNDYRIHF